MIFFFFFQAEDGIRDYKVTGVQTCALPILIPHGTFIKDLPYFPGWMDMFVVPQDSVSVERAIDDVTMAMREKIGRASCRERSVDLGGRRIIKKKKSRYREGED